MNVTLQIQDCTLQELQALFARLAGSPAATPVSEPEPASQPAPAAPAEAPAPSPAEDPAPTAEPAPRRAKPGTARRRLLEQQAERQRQEQELAAVIVTGENGIREPLGKAIERLRAERLHSHGKPLAGRHDDGTIRRWPTQKDAARELGVSSEYVRQCVRDCRKLRGWMFEEDSQPKGGAEC